MGKVLIHRLVIGLRYASPKTDYVWQSLKYSIVQLSEAILIFNNWLHENAKVRLKGRFALEYSAIRMSLSIISDNDSFRDLLNNLLAIAQIFTIQISIT